MTVYNIFDIAIACKFPITGLSVLEQGCADWSVDLASEALPGGEIRWFYSWKAASGDEVMACARHGEKYILKFNGLASFSIDFDSQEISVLAEDKCPENTLAHLLIDQVVPRIFGHLGRVVLHASAVELSDGQAVAFTGVSGQGKSTLATAFFNAGCHLLSDDCLLLENHRGTVYAMSSYPSLRLWADSAQAVVEEDKVKGRRYSEMAHYTKKRQLLFNPSDDSATSRWIKLDRLYLLESEPTSADSSLIQINAAGGMASIMALIESMFTLDVESEESIRRNFEAVQQVACGVLVKRLAYPRNFEVLPGVIDAVQHDQH